MAITILRIRGHAIRHNIHCTDPNTLVPILEIHNKQTIQLAFSVRFAGSCTIHYLPDNDPDVWIETVDTLAILVAPLLPPRHHRWCISTHTDHHRSNRKRIREQLALPLLPVLAVHKGRSGKVIHTNCVVVPQASDLIYADPTQGELWGIRLSSYRCRTHSRIQQKSYSPTQTVIGADNHGTKFLKSHHGLSAH